LDELTRLTAELVAIDSVNPSLVQGGAGEAEIARLVSGWLSEAGLDVEVLEPTPGRPSVLGVARGSGGGRSLMLNAHLDTVGTAGMENPLSGRVHGDRLYGRGSLDMKGSLAAIMLAGRAAAQRDLRGDVVIAAVADEEAGSIGTEALLERVRTDAAIVAEPTWLRLAIAHRGFVGLEVEVAGRAAHGSRPERGIDAIVLMGRVLVGLEALDRRLQSAARHRLLGTASAHASVIEGGQELSSYPGRCVLLAERRTLPGETAEDAQRELAAILQGAGRDDPDFRAEVRIPFARDAYELAPDDPFVEVVGRHAGRPEIVGMPFWADSGLIAAAGIPTVLFGPGGEGLHEIEEWVELADLRRCVEVYVSVAAEVCA
jgi:acetylornithine deacetylase/succinyl-diaminopimelate desuccinylase family protein